MKHRLKNLSIGNLLMLSYLAVVILFVGSAGFSVSSVHANAAKTEDFYERPYQVSRSAVMLRSTILETSGYLGQLVDDVDEADKIAYLNSIERLGVERTNEFNIVAENFAADTELLDTFTEANDNLVVARDEVTDAVRRGEAEQASKLYENEYLPLKDTALEAADDIVKTADEVATVFVQEAKDVERQTIVGLGVSALVAIALVLVMWRLITRAIAKPIKQMEEVAQRMAQGDLTAQVDYRAGNELGGLAASVNETASSLRATVMRLNEAAEQVARSSAQMSDSSQAIAQGSAEQAMAIEELATNVQSINRVVGKTTDNVLNANENAAGVLAAVERSDGQIARASEIIAAIKENTHSISHLANAIEDMSFQTNILALNASVEAARAGNAGSGFAIVAKEIRRLASQASDASKSADQLTERTISSVEEGVSYIATAAESMDGAVEATESVKAMMSEIATAATQQLEAVEQIRESMDRLSEVVQENSAASEESAVIGEELADQAEELRQLIARFQLDDRSGHAEAHRR